MLHWRHIFLTVVGMFTEMHSVTIKHDSFFVFKQKTAYEITRCLEFRRVLFRSALTAEHNGRTFSHPLFRRDHGSDPSRSEEHSLNSSHLVISCAVFCLKKKT